MQVPEICEQESCVALVQEITIQSRVGNNFIFKEKRKQTHPISHCEYLLNTCAVMLFTYPKATHCTVYPNEVENERKKKTFII